MHTKGRGTYHTLTWDCPKCGCDGHEVELLVQTDDYPKRTGCVEVSEGSTECDGCGYQPGEGWLVEQGNRELDSYDPREARADARED